MNAIATLVIACLNWPMAGSCAGDPPAPQQYQLALKAHTKARGLNIQISELCDITPVDADSLAIGKLRFGPAPAPGFPRTVTRTQLLHALVAAGHAPDSFQFRGAAEATVLSVAVDIASQRLIDEASHCLQAILNHEGGDVESAVVGRVRAVQAPAGHLSQELRARIRGGKTNSASAVIDVEVLVDGEVAKTVPVQFKLTRFQMVLQTVGTIRAGDALGAHNLRISRQKTSNTPGLYLTNFNQVDGAVAKRNLQPNRLLMLNDTGPPAVIRRGETVEVVITRRRVRVVVKGIASKDAAIGERLVVTNRQSRSQITGIVAGPGMVIVPTSN